jgi:hypothetical protein
MLDSMSVLPDEALRSQGRYGSNGIAVAFY